MERVKETEQYFALPDTPMAGSPVGTLMTRILEKNAGIGFEEVRTRAKVLLERAADSKRYRIPPVLTPVEEERRRAAGKAYWASRTAAKAA